MRLEELLRQGTERLREEGIEEASLDSRLLLCEAYGFDTARYLLKQHEEADQDRGAGRRFHSWIEERAKHRPLQYILGYTEFMGLRISLDESVLIPRQDTETLCELVLSEHKDRDIAVLDMCTGSGAIALSLAALGGYSKVIGTDISEAAVRLAAQNAEDIFAGDMGITSEKPHFYKADMFEGLDGIMPGEDIKLFDLIVSNPPYIRPEVIEGLKPEVRDHEPYKALYGGSDGLDFYRIIASEAPTYLKRPGWLYLEIGYDQSEDVMRLLEAGGFKDVETCEDLCGRPRVVKGRLY